MTNYTLDEYPVDYEWSFYHSFWFSFIVCSTVGKLMIISERILLFCRQIVGYGNSSPHDQPGQAFLIFYALIGLPVNGFVLAFLGNFFSESVSYEILRLIFQTHNIINQHAVQRNIPPI